MRQGQGGRYIMLEKSKAEGEKRHPSSPSATPRQGKAEMENQKATSI